MSLLHALSTGSCLTPAPPHWDSCHLPLFSPEPHGRCTLPDFQAFLYKEIQMKYRQNGINLYIGLREKEAGQWRWADQTPYNESAA